MRKIFILLASALAAASLVGCGGGDNGSSSSSPMPVTYTVTFRQSGQADIVKIVTEGGSLTDIPSTAAKTGYTVAWAETEFDSVTQNIVVNAVETPNQYTITYDPNGGSLDTLTQTVTYDAAYTLLTPTREDYDFVCWNNGTTGLTASGVWNIADNVTLTAQWEEVKPETVTVTFVQSGYENVVKTVEKGATLTDVPTPQEKTGYTVTWNCTDFSAVQSSFTVSAVETPNQYTVSYIVDGTTIEETTTVTYGAAYTLYKPSFTGYVFDCWLNGEQSVLDGSAWSIASDVTLTAKKTAKTYTVTLNAAGGTVDKTTVTLTYGEAFTLPTPTKSGYDFDGWKYNGKKVTAAVWEIDGEDIVLEAAWYEPWTDNY